MYGTSTKARTHDSGRDTAGPALLFVYGTLRAGSGHRMQRALARAAEPLGEAVFRGRLYWVARYPGVVASADPADRVIGEVYRLGDPEPVLRQLDRYEGCNPRDPNSAYVRRLCELTLASGRKVEAWIYLYNRETAALRRIESGDFLRGS